MIRSTEIVLVPIEQIKPFEKNRNIHTDDQIDRLMELISYQGFRNPLIVSKQTGNLLAGNGRLEAAKRLGLKEIPVIYQNFDNEDMEYAYSVSENAIQEWSELDLTGIHLDLPDLSLPSIDLLGIKDFEFEPEPKKEKQKKLITCPNCNHEFERGSSNG